MKKYILFFLISMNVSFTMELSSQEPGLLLKEIDAQIQKIDEQLKIDSDKMPKVLQEIYEDKARYKSACENNHPSSNTFKEWIKLIDNDPIGYIKTHLFGYKEEHLKTCKEYLEEKKRKEIIRNKLTQRKEQNLQLEALRAQAAAQASILAQQTELLETMHLQELANTQIQTEIEELKKRIKAQKQQLQENNEKKSIILRTYGHKAEQYSQLLALLEENRENEKELDYPLTPIPQEVVNLTLREKKLLELFFRSYTPQYLSKKIRINTLVNQPLTYTPPEGWFIASGTHVSTGNRFSRLIIAKKEDVFNDIVQNNNFNFFYPGSTLGYASSMEELHLIEHKLRLLPINQQPDGLELIDHYKDQFLNHHIALTKLGTQEFPGAKEIDHHYITSEYLYKNP